VKETIKKYLEGAGYGVDDVGTHSEESVDYPDFARAVGERVASGKDPLGVVLCATGIGVAIVANKVKGIYAALAGGNLIHDVGYLASGMTSSIEMLTIADEQISQIKRYLKSFALDKESLAIDLIDEIGPEGDFLATDLTLSRFKEEIWSPTIIDRAIHENWVAAGSTTLRDRAREKARDLLKNHQPACLPEDVKKEVRSIVKIYEQSRG